MAGVQRDKNANVYEATHELNFKYFSFTLQNIYDRYCIAAPKADLESLNQL